MKKWVGILSILLSVALSLGQMPEAISYDLKFGSPLNLLQYGGGNVELIINSSDIGSITVLTKDYDNLVPVVQTNINNVSIDQWNRAIVTYQNNVGYVPQETHEQVKKERGISIHGTVSKAYLIYARNELKVYYYDTASTAQNECALFIMSQRSVVKSAPKQNANSLPKEKISIASEFWIGPKSPPISTAENSQISKLAALTDPLTLSAENSMSLSACLRFFETLYLLNQIKFTSPDAALELAFATNGCSGLRAKYAKEQILNVYYSLSEKSAFTDENRKNYEQSFTLPLSDGSTIKFDRILPESKYQQYANELTNLKAYSVGVLNSENSIGSGLLTDEQNAQLLKLQRIEADDQKRFTEEMHEYEQIVSYLDKYYAWESRPVGWSRIGNALFSEGKIICEDIPNEAKARGLDEEDLIRNIVGAENKKQGRPKVGPIWDLINDSKFSILTTEMKSKVYFKVTAHDLKGDLSLKKTQPSTK